MLVPRSSRVQHLNVDGEDGVGPGGVRVHLGGPHGPVAPPLGHQCLALRGVTHCMQGDIWRWKIRKYDG